MRTGDRLPIDQRVESPSYPGIYGRVTSRKLHRFTGALLFVGVTWDDGTPTTEMPSDLRPVPQRAGVEL